MQQAKTIVAVIAKATLVVQHGMLYVVQQVLDKTNAMQLVNEGKLQQRVQAHQVQAHQVRQVRQIMEVLAVTGVMAVAVETTSKII